MMRQLCALAVGLVFLVVSADSVNVQTESTVNRWRGFWIHGPGNVTNPANFANTEGREAFSAIGTFLV